MTDRARGAIVALTDADGNPIVGIVTKERVDDHGISWWTVLDTLKGEYEVDATTVPVIDDERIDELRALLKQTQD